MPTIYNFHIETSDDGQAFNTIANLQAIFGANAVITDFNFTP